MKKALLRKVVSKIYDECSMLLKLYTRHKFSKSGKQPDAFDADSYNKNDRQDKI